MHLLNITRSSFPLARIETAVEFDTFDFAVEISVCKRNRSCTVFCWFSRISLAHAGGSSDLLRALSTLSFERELCLRLQPRSSFRLSLLRELVWLCLCLLLSCDRESRRLLCSREFERLLPPSVWPSSSPWSTSLSSCKAVLSL
jgi:hypothetical protein